MGGFPYTIAFWNVRGMLGKISEVENLCSMADVVGLAEARANVALTGFSTYFGDRGVVWVAVKSIVPHRLWPVQPCGGMAAVAVQVWWIRQWVTIVMAYCNGRLGAGEWNSWLGQLPRPLILCGDMNAHHWMWGASRQNQRGRVIADSLVGHGCVVLNDDTPTFCRWYGGLLQQSVLDLVICSSELVGVVNMGVSDDLRGSDHFPIWIAAALARQKVGVDRRCSKHTWLLEGEFGHFLQRWRLGIPQSGGRQRWKKGRNPLWWTDECRRAVCDRRRAYRRFLRWPSSARWFYFIGVSGEAKRILRAAKRSFGPRLCSAASGGATLASVWRLLSPAGSRYSVSWVLSLDGSTVLRGLPLANAINEQFAKIYSEGVGIPCPKVHVEEEHVLASTVELAFELQEMLAALAKCKDGAPGVDGVTYSDLRALGLQGRQELLQLFNSVWESSMVPAAWRYAVLTPVPRVGKDRSRCDSYRPIALLSCVGKLFERLVIGRISWFVETVGGLHAAQFGFRKGRGAQDAILLLEAGIREAWVHGNVVLGVFLDIRAAYDTVVHDWMYAELHRLGIGHRVLRVLEGLLKDRIFVTRAGGYCSDSKTTSRGLPQGSCLSPLLFAVLLNSLLEMATQVANVVAFADDVALWLVGPDVESLQTSMQKAVNAVEGWLTDRGMGLSPGKSQVVVFARGNVLPAHLCIAGQQVRSVNQIKYLGIMLDSQLLWRAELTAVRETIVRASRVLLAMVHKKEVCKRGVLRTFFEVFIQSRVDYHLPFLCEAQTVLKGIQVEINKCLRVVTGCLTSTSVPALHVEAGVLPQYWRARGQLLKLVLRGLGRGGADLLGRILGDYLGLGMRELQVLGSVGLGVRLVRGTCLQSFCVLSVAASMGPWIWGPTLEGIVLGGDGKTNFPGLHVYSDASFDKVSWSGGIGVAVPELKLGYSWRIPHVPSSFSAELAAMSLGIDVGLALGVQCFTVLSDSRAGIHFLKESFSRLEVEHPMILEVGLKIFGAKQAGVCVFIGWVRGHAGVWGNEEADTLARKGSQSDTPVTVYFSARDLKPVVAAVITDSWEQEWLGEERGRDLFALHPSVSRPRDLDMLPQRDAAVLSRLRTGHVLLPGHAYEIGLALTPSCGCGWPWGSVAHFLTDCPLFATERSALKLVVGGVLSLPHLLGIHPHAEGAVSRRLRAVVRFCRRTGAFR